DRASLIEVGTQGLEPDRAHAGLELLGAHPVHLEDLGVVAQVGQHPPATRAPQPAPVDVGQHPTQVRLELAHPTHPQGPREERGERAHRAHEPHGRALAHTPQPREGRPRHQPRSRICARTVAARWTIVTRLARLSRPSATVSTTTGAPIPTTPVATSTIARRSARSAIPTLAVRPSPSARARA